MVITRRGRPVAMLRLLTDEEREDYLVSTHPGFVELIRNSRETCPPGSGIPLDEVERELRPAPARRSRRSAARG